MTSLGPRVWFGSLVIAAGLHIFIAHVQATEETNFSLRALHQLNDSEFIGALNAEELVLGKTIAAKAKQALPGEDVPCVPDSTPYIRVVGNGPNEKIVGELKAPLPEILEVVAHGSPVQRAVALYAIGLIGPKAHDLFKKIQIVSSLRNSWAIHALDGITCQRWSGGGFSTAVSDTLPPSTSPYECDAPRARWLIHQAKDATRHWPKGFFETAWYEVTSGCALFQHHPMELDADALNDMVQIVSDDKYDSELWAELLGIAITLEHQGAPIAKAAKWLIRSPDAELSHRAKTLALAAGIPEAVDVLRRWLLEEHVPHWMWENRIAGLSDYRDGIVPILVAELSDSTFTNRAAAARALGTLHAETAIDPLKAAISSFDWLTSQAAVASLAQFAATHTDVDATLKAVASDYWSGRIRAVAEVALRKGEGIRGNPFGCGKTPDEILAEEHASSDGKLNCIEFGYGSPVDHKLPTCLIDDAKSARYRTIDDRILRVRWEHRDSKVLPRGIKRNEISSWCSNEQSRFSVARLPNGWLVGCLGFEAEGMLSFVPREGPATPQPLVHMGLALLVQLDGHIYASGSAPFEFGNAGGLYELTHDPMGKWNIALIAALPSVPENVAVVGHALVFQDEKNVVLFDPHDGISRLSCNK